MMKRTICSKTLMALSMSVALGLSACGGSDSPVKVTDDVKTGVFIDAPVKSLGYETPTQSGATNEKGEFNYKAGESIVFSIDGVEIGSINASEQVLVTDLYDATQIAQLLQSLDVTPPDDNLIDLTGVKFPESLKATIRRFLDGEEGISSADANDFNAFLTAHLGDINTESGNVLHSTTPVNQEDALAHIDDFFDVNLELADVSKQTYIGDNDGKPFVISFKEDGTGNEFDGLEVGVEKKSFNWSLDEVTGQLTWTDESGFSTTVDLLNKTGNSYTFKVVDDSAENNNALFVGNLNKANTLNAEMLDGKILGFDTSGETNCTARTAKIDGTVVSMKEQCVDTGFNEETLELSNASQLDNTIYFKKVDQNSVELERVKIHLYDGTIDDGNYVFIDNPQQSSPDDIFFVKMHTVDAELVDELAAQTAATKALLADKTFYAFVPETDGSPMLAQVDINAEVDTWTVTGIEGLVGSFDEGLFVEGTELTISHSDGDETVPVLNNDANYLSLGENASLARLYYTQADAQAYYNSQVSTGVDVFKFSTDYLNGKTLYNVYECILGEDQNGACAAGEWIMSVFDFSADSLNAYESDINGQVLQGGFGVNDLPYSITSEGYITMTTGGDTDYIKPIELTEKFIRADWSGTREGLNTEEYEYFFFNLTDAQAFINSKSQ